MMAASHTLTSFAQLSPAHKCRVTRAIKHTWPDEWLVSRRTIRTFIEHHPPEWCRVAVRDGHVTGFCLVSWADDAVTAPEPPSTSMSNATLWLKGLFVFPEARRQGLGGRLVEEARETARAHGGAECFDLYVLEKDPNFRGLVDFYWNMGFTYGGTRVDAVTQNTEHRMSCRLT